MIRIDVSPIKIETSTVEQELERLKKFYERRYIDGRDIQILELEIKNINKKYDCNIRLEHNFYVRQNNQIFVNLIRE